MVKQTEEGDETSSVLIPNELYSYVHLYLGTLKDDATAITADWPKAMKTSPFLLLLDILLKNKLEWFYYVKEDKENTDGDRRWYELNLPNKYKSIVQDYLHHIEKRGKEIQHMQQKQRLYCNYVTYDESDWYACTFTPTATFDTVAMDPSTRELVTNDIKQFMNSRDYYSSIGRPWKRGYLLYGPPGTGKSSLIGAMANLTGYDVFNVELGCVKNNTGLMQLLWKVGDKAIIVIEDIDCCVSNRQKKNKKQVTSWFSNGNDDEGITLSGLLNFTDGIQSSCGSERIFVFTTNYIDRLDEALVRPGRMDMHICLSYCTFPVFEDIARIYLKHVDRNIQECYYPRIKDLLSQIEITPARVVEQLVRHRDDPQIALTNLVEQLQQIKDTANNTSTETSTQKVNEVTWRSRLWKWKKKSQSQGTCEGSSDSSSDDDDD